MGGQGREGYFTNPVVLSDVPDPDVVYDGRQYYMVSTTMYFAPSVPIMRSSDLVHWSIAGYTGPVLDDTDALALRNGENAYGQGSWAASIRHHDGTYYVSVGSLTTQETYIYSAPSVEHGPWTRSVLDGYAHDQSLLFDGDDATSSTAVGRSTCAGSAGPTTGRSSGTARRRGSSRTRTSTRPAGCRRRARTPTRSATTTTCS